MGRINSSFESETGLLRVTIDREQKRNALRLDLLDELRETFTRYADQPELKLAVLRGAGEKSFAAGGDLQELEVYRTPEQAGEMADRGRTALDAIRQFPLPVIAALNGVALGGGAELAMACDFRLAASHARIGFVQGRLNVTTAWGGGADLINRVGPDLALRLLCRAEILSAGEALELQLLDEVAADGESLDELLQRSVSPLLEQSPRVLRGFKAQAVASRQMGRAAQIAVERQQLVTTWVHPDHWAAAAKAGGSRHQAGPG
ncbi:MAG: enoyl-CoA hydratase/isomerase family protein [Gammaproteobacteria bacterium]|nr:enoyl-CoA hydratase/isomerase family protein [Gammaproteobacteria bacterium]